MRPEPINIRLRNGKEATIREATIKDADGLITAAKAYLSTSAYLCSYPEEFNPTHEEETGWIEAHKNDNSLLLVAEYKDKILATLNATGFQNKKMKHIAVLGVSILEEWRGIGLGSILFDILISWAKNTDLEILVLEVFSDNVVAINLYKKYGFVTDGIRRKYFKDKTGDYHDNVLMSLNLK